MILKGSTRKGGRNLSDHMLNDHDNDHVEVHELRGFAAETFSGAVQEVDALAKGTRVQKAFYSLSLNPQETENVSERDFERAIDKCEKALGLEGQPRAILFHEKEGRRHAHVIWSRIDPETLNSKSNSNDRYKLREVSRELYQEHGWKMPPGLAAREDKGPSRDHGEQSVEKRSDVNLEDHQRLIREAWDRSDDAQSLAVALEQKGYILAHGNRGHVAVDITTGDPHALTRRLGMKKKEVEAKLGPAAGLPTVEAAKKQAAERRRATKDAYNAKRQRHDKALKQLAALKDHQRKERRDLVRRQKADRDALERDLVAKLGAEIQRGLNIATAHLLRLRDQFMGKDNDAEARQRIVEARQTLEDKHRADRDNLRQEQIRQRQEFQRQLNAERHVNRQAALDERLKDQKARAIAARKAEIEKHLSQQRRKNQLHRS